MSALADDLRRTMGYSVADSRGRVWGKVESPLYGTRPAAPDAISARTRFSRRPRPLPPPAATEQTDATSGVIGPRGPRETVQPFL